jgi:hypothetical protein
MFGSVRVKRSEVTEERWKRVSESRLLMEDGSAVKVMIKGAGLAIVAVVPIVRLCARKVIKNWAR